MTLAVDADRLVGQLVCLERSLVPDPRPAEGFLVAASEAWLVIHRVSDRLDLDGYRAFRTRDVTALSGTARRLEVVRRAVELKSLAPGDPGPLDLTDTRGLLDSAQERHGALVIERERRDPQAFSIGRVRLASEQTFTLRPLSPDAEWEPEDRVFRYEDVTSVGFGGEYETTLERLAEQE